MEFVSKWVCQKFDPTFGGFWHPGGINLCSLCLWGFCKFGSHIENFCLNPYTWAFWQTSGSPWGFPTQALGLVWVLVDWCIPTPLAGLSLRVAVWTGFSNCSMARTSHEFVPIVKWLTVVLVINKYFTIKNCVYFVKLCIYYQTQFRHLTIGTEWKAVLLRVQSCKNSTPTLTGG